jgi:heme-degrading monooxygenase HmoA
MSGGSATIGAMTSTTTIEAGRPIATLINVFTVAPERQAELATLLTRVTEEIMRHQPGFISANIHSSTDGERVVNYAQWETEQHFQAMLVNPVASEHMAQAAELALSFEPRLFTVESVHHV